MNIHHGAAERTRTSTGLLLPAPQAGASTIPPRPLISFFMAHHNEINGAGEENRTLTVSLEG